MTNAASTDLTLLEALKVLHDHGKISPNMGLKPPVVPNPTEHGDLTLFKFSVLGGGRTPDLASPAEVALLLALLREVTGYPYCHIEPPTKMYDRWVVVYGPHGSSGEPAIDGPTEGEAVAHTLIVLARRHANAT